MFGPNSPLLRELPGLWAAIGTTLVATLALLWAERFESFRGRLTSKPIAALGFLALAWLAQAPQTTPGLLIFIGLIFSFIGDVCLIFRAPALFLAGLGSFLLGHVFYAIAFLLLNPDLTASGLTLALCAPLVWLIYGDLRPDVPDEMRVPVIAYMVVITGMVVFGVGAVVQGAPVAFAVAAVAFYLSDIAVALERFKGGGFGVRALGLPLYFGAQLLFALAAGALPT